MMASLTKDNLASYNFCFLYTFLLCQCFKTVGNESEESRCPCPIPGFRENALRSSPFHMLDKSLSYITFIILRCVPSIPNFSRNVII